MLLGKVWTAFLLFGAAASVVAWIAALCHEKGFRPFAGATRFVRGLPWGGRLALLPLFVALVAYGGSKYVGEVQGEGERVGESISNRVDRVDGGESDYLAQSSQSPQSGEMVVGNSCRKDSNLVNPVKNSQLTTLNSELITQSDCEAGFVLSGIGTGEAFDFSPPDNAVICEDWLKFGAHRDWLHLPLGWFSFPFGGNSVERLSVLSSGALHPVMANPDVFMAPFRASLGIVPEANWGMINFR